MNVALPPAVPQGLSATLLAPASKARYTVSFQAVGGASYYELHERSEQGTVPAATRNLGLSTSETYARPGVSDTLYYQVRACGAGGCSAWSDEVDVILGGL